MKSDLRTTLITAYDPHASIHQTNFAPLENMKITKKKLIYVPHTLGVHSTLKKIFLFLDVIKSKKIQASCINHLKISDKNSARTCPICSIKSFTTGLVPTPVDHKAIP